MGPAEGVQLHHQQPGAPLAGDTHPQQVLKEGEQQQQNIPNVVLSQMP